MNKSGFFLFSLALLVSSHAFAQDVDWNVDMNHSRVAFTARHLGFSKVEGQFKKFDAKIKADAKTGKISSLEATADVSSVNTDVDKRDEDLRSEHFFDAKKYPQLKLKLKSISWKGTKFTAKVALTMRDVTKDVEFTGELLGAQEVDFGRGKHMRAAYEAEATVNRKEFGLNYSAVAEGLAIVGDEVQIHLTVEMSYTPPKA